MNNHIVVGANFGDEGKGLVTNYLASKHRDAIVIRFNGGAQAAHTVELEDGRRHVFHHIGSGTFQNCPTLLSEHFIFNPNALLQELIQLPHEHPTIYAHRDALLSTPFDWELNRAVERKRGASKHGSCGMGINETVTRSTYYPTFVKDMYRLETFRDTLHRIQDEWVPKRAAELGVDPNIEVDIDEYLGDCLLARGLIGPVRNYNVLKSYKNRIFEGAQGLLLDEFHWFFPHVTRSRTGNINATNILESIGEIEADVHYVTRTYATRHGKGPMAYEDNVNFKQDDLTNIPNKHQGELRFGPLDLGLMRESIRHDIASKNTKVQINPQIDVTWAHINPDIIGYTDRHPGEKLKQLLPLPVANWFGEKTTK